jgi:hypothetical protein
MVSYQRMSLIDPKRPPVNVGFVAPTLQSLLSIVRRTFCHTPDPGNCADHKQ